MNTLAKSCCTLLVAFATANAQAIPLTDLLAGETIRVGDKLFHDWEMVLALDPTEGSAIDTDLIDVSGLDADLLNPGLHFESDGTLKIDAPTDVDGDELFLWFAYTVTVLDPTMRISSVSMDLTGAETSGTGGLAWVSEEIDFGIIATLDVYIDDTGTGPGPGTMLADSAGVGSRDSLLVDNIILVSAFTGDSAELKSFDQYFKQSPVVVPLPGTAALLAAGMFGFALYRRRRH